MRTRQHDRSWNISLKFVYNSSWNDNDNDLYIAEFFCIKKLHLTAPSHHLAIVSNCILTRKISGTCIFIFSEELNLLMDGHTPTADRVHTCDNRFIFCDILTSCHHTHITKPLTWWHNVVLLTHRHNPHKFLYLAPNLRPFWCDPCMSVQWMFLSTLKSWYFWIIFRFWMETWDREPSLQESCFHFSEGNWDLPGSDQPRPTPWSCKIIIISDINTNKMLFALLVMFSPLSISGGREMSHEIINILQFSLCTYIQCYLSLTTEIHSSHHKYRQRGNKFHNDFIFN